MAHIHTKPGQHDHTVSMFVVRTDADKPKIMFHLHKKHNCFMQFGGHIELAENPWQAIIRELKEEAGYDINQLEILQPPGMLKKLTGAILHPYPIAYTTHATGPHHRHIDTAFAFVTDQKPLHTVDEAESNNIKLFSRSELIDIPSKMTYENGRQIALFILDTALNKWKRIPAGKMR